MLILTLIGVISSKERTASRNKHHGFKQVFHFSFLLKPPEKGCEMRERTAVKVARFVPGREGKSNLSFRSDEASVMDVERGDCVIQF
jgi:hypothetical protein